MLSTSELLTAAKSGRGIPSNYRLARVMGLSDQTIFRWHSGAGAPDDAHAAELAVMAGLDVEYVVVAMRALREKDPTLRAIWAGAAKRLLLTSTTGGTLPPVPPSPEGNNGDFGPSGDDAGTSGALMSGGPSDNAHYAQYGCEQTPEVRRLRRLRASLGRALKAKAKSDTH